MVWPFFSIEEEPAGARSPKHNLVDGGEEEQKTVEEALECDYERDCTTLYKAIENAVNPADFEPIIKFLDTGYWPNAFFPDSVPPADQAKTWVTRFDTEDSNKVKWSQLPLHLAIVCDAPSSIIGRLVKLYPQALRCTDDQHMLPLHLALRHGADDEIIAFLLIRFPDAVNAKGKNGRSAVDCAMRAKDKLRGKILEIFVEKTKTKSHSTLTKENKFLKTEIEKKNTEIDELKLELDTYRNENDNLKSLKNTIEADLLMKIQELEQSKAEIEVELADKVDKLESERLLHDMEVQKKKEELYSSKKEFEENEAKAKQEEESLRKELDSLQSLVKISASPEDWNRLKNEVEQLQAYRLQHTRSDMKMTLETLKGNLEQAMQVTRKSESRNSELKRNMEKEMSSIKQTIRKLEDSAPSAKTSSELLELRKEIDELKKELKERSEATRAKLDLVLLKKQMEVELHNAEGKTSDQITRLQKAILDANDEKLVNKTNAELISMKAEMEKLRAEMYQRELGSKTKKDVEKLQAALEAKLVKADQKSKKELEQMKKTVDALSKTLMSNQSSDEMIAIKKDLEDVKDQLKKKEAVSKIANEAQVIRKSLEAELKRSEGKTTAELVKLKQSINELYFKALENKDVSELKTIKAELSSVKDQLKAVEKAARTQTELDELKKTLAQELKHSNGRTEEELSAMKKAVDEINLEQQASKALKERLETEIKAVNGKTQLELLEMKRTIDSIDLKQLEVRNKSEWDKMQSEICQLKDELNSKKILHVSKTEREISEIKKVIDELAAKQAQNQELHSRDAIESLAALRIEMDELKTDLKNKAIDASNLIQEIELLKLDGQKHKAGLKKFFSTRISSWTHPRLQDIASADETEVGDRIDKSDTYASDAPSTFRPPSLTAKRYSTMMAAAYDANGSIMEDGSSNGSEAKNGSRTSKKSTSSLGSRPPLAPPPKLSQLQLHAIPVVETAQSMESKISVLTNRTGYDLMSQYRKDVAPDTTAKGEPSTQTISEPSLKQETVTEQEVVLHGESNKMIDAKAEITDVKKKVLDHCDTGSITSAAQEQRDEPPPPSPPRALPDETQDNSANSATGKEMMKDESSGQHSTGSRGGLFKRIRSPPKTNLFRKVKSMMDPSTHSSRSEKSKISDAVEALSPPPGLTRTQSKAHINENGEVELQTFET